MKKLLLFIMVVSVGLFTAFAQSPEVGPASDAPSDQQEALFDVLFTRCPLKQLPSYLKRTLQIYFHRDNL